MLRPLDLMVCSRSPGIAQTLYSASDCAKEVRLEADLQQNLHSSDPVSRSRSTHLLLGLHVAPGPVRRIYLLHEGSFVD